MDTYSRIPPVEKPRNILSRIAYAMLRRQFGKVITPAKVIYARYPSMFTWVKKMNDIEDKQIKLPAELKLLIKYYTAHLNGCDFCLDIGMKLAQNRSVSTAKFRDIETFETSDSFTAAEKSALRFAGEANKKHVPDEVFAQVKEHYSDKEIIGIAFIVATENYYNIMNHSLGISSDQLCSFN